MSNKDNITWEYIKNILKKLIIDSTDNNHEIILAELKEYFSINQRPKWQIEYAMEQVKMSLINTQRLIEECSTKRANLTYNKESLRKYIKNTYNSID